MTITAMIGCAALAGEAPITKNPAHPGAIERLYVLNGGFAVAPDRSAYSPGLRHGEQVALSCNAYLIRRAGEWLLWDTGIADALAAEPGGRIIAHGIRGIVVRTLADQLAEIGVAPADVGTVILSHAHFDHVGNAALFAHATWRIQRREHAAMFGPDYASHGYDPSLYDALRHARVELMDGDLDLFGDGSMEVVSTPGHTPGHCSLLVRLARAGAILLSADAAHDRFNLEHRCVPTMNSDPGQSRRSMDRLEAVARDASAQLWLNHDMAQTATIPHAPSCFE